MNWLVYLLACCDGSLYCGVTNNIEQRIVAHQRGKGSKYVRSRLPFRLVEHSRPMSKSAALRTEAAVKRLRKDKKLHADCWV